MTKHRSLAFTAIAIIVIVCGVGFIHATTPVDLDNLPTGTLDDETTHALFVAFLQKYEKTYETNEISNRITLFRDNVQWMINFNANRDNTHIVGINQFADLAPEEWPGNLNTGIRHPAGWTEPNFDMYDILRDEDNDELQDMLLQHPELIDDAPRALDWTVEEQDESGKVTRPKALLPIRNQLSCGSCYSFSAMATVEALYRINFWELTPNFDYFSTQQGVDCTGPRYGCSYCQGGWMMSVYRYLIDNKGVCLEKNYPYQNQAGRCRASQCRNAFHFDTYRDISGHSEGTLVKHLAVNPLAIAVTSATREFMYYRGGILTYCGSPYANIDHAVNAVAYDLDAAQPWFKIRNSWGANWGEAGHIRVGLGANLCKWRTNVSYPVLSTGPKTELPEFFREEVSSTAE